VNEVDENLLRIIDKNTLALYQEQIHVFDQSRKLIYSNSTEKFDLNSIVDHVDPDDILRFRQKERETIAFMYRYDNREYYVIASAFDVYGIAKIKYLRIILIVGFLFSLMISVAGGLVFSGKALQPISRIVKQVKMISISKLNLRLEEGNKKDELAQLAITFNQMLQRLEEAFILQRDFVSNAAHELRTPFTVMLAEIDYCLMHRRSLDQYTQTLKRLSDEIRNISQLSNGLLDLARISYDNSGLEFRKVRIDEMLVDTCNDLLKSNRDYKTHINFNNLPDNEGQLNVSGNEQLLKIAIRNLLENACKFSCSREVFINLEVNEGRVVLQIKDNGIGIPQEDIGKIFQPFYRGNNASYFGGFGLGLALTWKIIQMHEGTILVQSILGEGSVFTVQLPNNR
jgi:signal transduction histidine kinase